MSALLTRSAPARSTSGRSPWSALTLPLAALLVLGLATYHLTSYPTTWFDEGLNLAAARTLAATGRYGLASADGFHPFDILLTTGPTVIVPIAVAFRWFGVGLAQARLVMVGYLLLAALGLYSVARQLYGQTVGAVTLLVLASVTTAGVFANGRDALGDVPALAFLYCGGAVATGAAQSAPSARRIGLLLGGGVLVGLAALTKPQLIVAVPWLAGLGWLRRSPSAGSRLHETAALLGGAALPLAGWYGYQLAVLGGPGFLSYLHQASVAASVTSYVAPFHRSLAAANFLVTSGFVAWGLVGLLYCWVLTIGDDWRSHPERSFALVFATFWLGWYLVVSIAWPRYAVPLAVTASIFEAKLFADLLRANGPMVERLFQRKTRATGPDLLGAALVLGIALTVASGIVTNAETIARSHDASPQQFAATIQRQVASGAVVESAEWELDFQTDLTFHHPPAAVVDDGVRVLFLNTRSTAMQPYAIPQDAAYLVDGPFSKGVGLYRQVLASGEFQRVATVGPYDLFRRKVSSGQRLSD
jgi:hypothetical protein